ncbi:MAG: DNA recombination protein RmuC [Candidatus Thalassarchaeaceae archaeon]|nr:DNA recombination protein RmuC [Candidatus Thalassarchaeaceae archaeon]
MEAMGLAYVALGMLAGASLGWALARSRTKSETNSVEEELIRAKALLEVGRKSEEKTHQQMLDGFRIAAGEAFSKAVETADKQKESSFKRATEDLRQDLGGYIEAIQDAKEKDIARVATLGAKVDNVSALGTSLAQETRELTLALRGDSQAQGAWGEVVVENLLQSMGFVEGRDYIKQEWDKGKNGEKGKRADFILKLPENRQVVIDSKVSLTAYTEFVNAEDDATSDSAMKAHCRSIREHSKKLATKNYEDMEGYNTPDFVLMVVPLEGAFIDAMRADQNLYEDLLVDRRVKVVSGSSLMLTLMLIQELWKREKQTSNQKEIVERGGRLHDKVVLFLETFTALGYELGQATDAYEKALEQLSSGSGNVIRQTEMLKELGSKTKKDLREKSGLRSLAERAEEEESFPESSSEDHDRLGEAQIQ